jgi:4-amino-4-deoxy-L-arabinose transferase-like glycosyltransferase
MSDEEKKTSGGTPAAQDVRSNGSWLWLLTLLLATAFILTGLTGHGPWTAGEADTLTVIEDVAGSGDYASLASEGDVGVASPPLYYAAGAGLVQVLSGYLPTQDAARVATGVFLAITLFFTGLLGRSAWRPSKEGQVPNAGVGAVAVLLLIGTVGMFWYGHDMIADSAMAAGLAVALYGLSLLPRQVLLGGLWLGTGVGISFTAKGLFGPGVLAVTALLLPFLTWRGFGRYLRGYVVAAVFALPWLLAWPLLVQQVSLDALLQWYWGGVDRYLDGVGLGTPERQLQWLWVFVAMSFPASLLAALTLVLRPGALFGFSGVRAVVIAALVGWGLLVTSTSSQPVDSLALLVPLAVIGAGGIRRLPGLLVWPLHWIAVLLFAVAAVAAWGAWIWMLYQGTPPPVDQLGDYLPMDQGFTWQPAAYVIAALTTVIWFWAAAKFRASRPAGLLVWPAGVVMLWSLLSLHGPWIDAAIAEGKLEKSVPGEVMSADQPGATAAPEAASAEPAEADAPVEAPTGDEAPAAAAADAENEAQPADADDADDASSAEASEQTPI